MEALAVIWAPVRTLASVAEDRRVLLGFIVLAISATLGLVFSTILVFSGYTKPGDLWVAPSAGRPGHAPDHTKDVGHRTVGPAASIGADNRVAA